MDWVDPRKWGKHYADFAIKRGREVVFQTIEMLEKADPADPWYGLYREQLKFLLMSEDGRAYEHFRNQARSVHGEAGK